MQPPTHLSPFAPHPYQAMILAAGVGERILPRKAEQGPAPVARDATLERWRHALTLQGVSDV